MIQTISFQQFKQFYATFDNQAIRLISFQSFKQLGTFPRYPDNRDLVISLEEIDEETYNKSLFIFISHCWLRGWSGAIGWDGRPHPDNAEGGKYTLCTEGIEKVLHTLVLGMKECYLWLDYGCIDQDGNPADELKYLDKIVQLSDMLFTPIYDESHSSWTMPAILSSEGYYTDCKSPAWLEGQQAYLNRGWCRIEMFYGSNIPLIEDGEERRRKMKAGLLYLRTEGKRPHVLYGSKQQADRVLPVILPPMQNTYFEKYNPIEGCVTNEADRETIIRLVEELKPYMKSAEVGYEGEKDGRGMMHGKGKYTYENGDVYVGDWKNDTRHGYGTYTFPDGTFYKGEWKDNLRHGKGSYIYSSGSVYEGEWRAGERHGQGKQTFADGVSYEGYYQNNVKHGKGKYIFATGDIYEGEWENDKANGYGKYSYVNGSIYEGEYKNDQKHGKGKFVFPSGNVYVGEWKEDRKDGKGKFTYATGNTFEGSWKADKKHGKGKYITTDGSVLIQTYEENRLVSEIEQKQSKCILC